jgi:hypothetical protein
MYPLEKFLLEPVKKLSQKLVSAWKRGLVFFTTLTMMLDTTMAYHEHAVPKAPKE